MCVPRRTVFLECCIRLNEVCTVHTVLHLRITRRTVKVALADRLIRVTDVLVDGCGRGVKRPRIRTVSALRRKRRVALFFVEHLGIRRIDISGIVGEQPRKDISVRTERALLVLLAAVEVCIVSRTAAADKLAAFALEPCGVIGFRISLARDRLHAVFAVPRKRIEHIRASPVERTVFCPCQRDIALCRVVIRTRIIRIRRIRRDLELFTGEAGHRDDIALALRVEVNTDGNGIACRKRIAVVGILIIVERTVAHGNTHADEGRFLSLGDIIRLTRVRVGVILIADGVLNGLLVCIGSLRSHAVFARV